MCLRMNEMNKNVYIIFDFMSVFSFLFEQITHLLCLLACLHICRWFIIIIIMYACAFYDQRYIFSFSLLFAIKNLNTSRNRETI